MQKKLEDKVKKDMTILRMPIFIGTAAIFIFIVLTSIAMNSMPEIGSGSSLLWLTSCLLMWLLGALFGAKVKLIDFVERFREHEKHNTLEWMKMWKSYANKFESPSTNR